MNTIQFDMKLIHILIDLLHRLQREEPEAVLDEFSLHLKDKSAAEILPIVQELRNGDYGITAGEVRKLFRVYQLLHGRRIDEWDVPESSHPGHPLQIFIEENRKMAVVLNRISALLEAAGSPDEEKLLELQEEMALFGQFYNHYNRKEKLYFPILERYGYYTPGRVMWGEDDRIRALYKGTKSMLERLPELDIIYVKKSYSLLQEKFTGMIFEEESFLLPITAALFAEEDWLAIARESSAYGYALIEPEEWTSERGQSTFAGEAVVSEAEMKEKHLPFGAGYLTLEEANVIFNNLPLEITFVDKNGIFKYFNEKAASSEMMFIRTKTSIGRIVANCHPPKSLSKVMQLIRICGTC